MRCPKCNEQDDKVIDTRTVRNGSAIRRRRACLLCRHRFTTYEEVVRTSLKVVKRDGRHEDLDRQKLLSGINRSCEKRPISIQQVENIADQVITELEGEYDLEIPSTAIGAKVMERLEKLDEIAYVRFASVYRCFRDVNQFLSEVEGLIERE